MRLARTVCTVAAVVALCAFAQPAAATTIFDNTIYEVEIDVLGDGTIGNWTARTSGAHPAGGGKSLLFPGPSTSFSTLRVYAAAGPADYTFGGIAGGIDMDLSFVSEGASPLGVVGHRTNWVITAHGLGITQDVFIVGGAFASSAVYHTVEITNSGSVTQAIGWRNLYDWALDDPGFDDGPNNSVENGGVVVAPTTFEFSHMPAAGEFVRISVDPGVPTYEPLLGIGFDPGFHPLTLTVPDEYAYVSWPSSFGTTFDYTTGPINVTGDSAGLSWFGRTAGSAYILTPGASVRFTQVVFGVLPDAPPPGMPEPGLLALLAAGAFVVLVQRRH